MLTRPLTLANGLALFALCFVLRLANAFSVSTFFQPDEYFQAWEPAYYAVTGRGYVSWEWDAGIRTSLIPRLFVGIIRVAQKLGIDHLVVGKVVMAAVAAVADVHTVKLAEILLGTPKYARQMLVLTLGSAWNMYVSTRPFSNTLEMALVVTTLCHWPLRKFPQSAGQWIEFISASVAAHVTIALRPSNGLLWMLLGVHLVLNVARSWRQRFWAVTVSVFVTIVAQGSVLWLDLPLTGKIPFVEFMAANFGAKVSEIYGVMPWHYYFSQGVPLLLICYLPFGLVGMAKLGPGSLVVQLIVAHLIAFSLVAHKEVRFIYYLLPLLHCCCAFAAKNHTVLLGAATAVNFVVGTYMLKVHQRGVVDVISWLRDANTTEVSFLMPCHSTPWHAHLDRSDLAMDFLTCTPPWNVTDPAVKAAYVDEADQFYADPKQFLAEHPAKLAQTVVIFDALNDQIGDVLGEYKQVRRFFNSHFHEDWRRRGDVVVLQRPVDPVYALTL